MRRSRMSVLTVVLAASASIGWYTGSFGGDQSSSTKPLGAIVDTFGCISGPTRTGGGSTSLNSLFKIGANWSGSQYLWATEPMNTPAKRNVEEHIYQDENANEDVWVEAWTACPEGASGQANWLVPFEEWWFNPLVSVTQLQPELWVSTDGAWWAQQGLDPHNGTNTLGWATQDGAGQGTGVRYASATGESVNGPVGWSGDQYLSHAPKFIKVAFPFLTVTSADCDNCVCSSYQIFLDCDVSSTIQ